MREVAEGMVETTDVKEPAAGTDVGAKTPRMQWCRKVMNDETMAFVRKFPTETMDALEISGDVWGRRRTWKSYETRQYPDFDLNYDVVPGKTFDIIFLEQVLEHVRYPYRSVRNIHRMLRPKGWVVSTTPFLVSIHGGTGIDDYTRWTPRGLTYLFEEGGFDRAKMTVGSWGNRQCIIGDLNRRGVGQPWQLYIEGKHSLVNEPRFPAECWIMAQKD